MFLEPESDEDDSDGEFELHPLLTASHRSASNTPSSSAPSSPTPQSIAKHQGHHYNAQSDGTYYDGYPWTEQTSYYHGK